MKIDYPYEMTISNKNEARNAIINMCNNCDNFFYCTGAMSKKCNQVKENIKKEFSS